MPLRILMPSIVDPMTFAGGAGAVTRGLVALLTAAPFNASVTVAATPARHPAAHVRRQYTSLARAVVRGAPAKVLFQDTGALRRQVRGALGRQRFDLVLVNGTDMAWVLDELPSTLPRALVAHNIEHEVYRAQIRHAWSWSGLLRPLLVSDWGRLYAFERAALARTPTIFLSRHDFAQAQAHGRLAAAAAIAPAFAYPLPERRPPRRPGDRLRLGLVANFGWWPNRDGARWFIERVLPELDVSTELHLFGPRSSAFARPPRVVAHGFQDRLTAAFEACDLMVCPVHVGGGVSIKLAETLYHRMPVVSTRFAARGLPAIADEAVVLLDDAREWIDFLRSRAASDLAGRRVSVEVARQFSIEAARAPMEAFLNDVCARTI